MENDLISRSALLEELYKGTIIPDDMYSEGIMAGVDHAIKKVKVAPAVDAVEVVRCKKCRFVIQGNDPYHNLYCENHNAMDDCVHPTDFCSYGERREDI